MVSLRNEQAGGVRIVGGRVPDDEASQGTQLAAANSYRERFTTHLTHVLGTDGVLVMPTVADIAPLIGESGERLESYRNRSIQMLCLAGLSGFPQISLPLGQRLGAPLGLSLLGPAGSDMSLVRLAQHIASTK